MPKFICSETRENNIDVVTLSCDSGDASRSITIKISPHEGNNLFYFNVGGNDLIAYDPSLSLADYLTGTPILFPFPNRIEDCLWHWNGKTYIQKKDGIPIQLHSLVYDEKWEYETPYADENGAYLKTFIKVDERHPIYKGYSFKFELRINYRLTSNSVIFAYEVVNRDDKTMPYGFALHPFFTRISGDDGTMVCVPLASRYEARDDVDPAYLNKFNRGFALVGNILPTGKLLSADGKYDLSTPVPVGALVLDDVYTNKQVGRDVCIDYTKQGIKLYMKTSDEFTHYTIYTPPGESYFAIEPQTCCTDAVNLYARGVEHTGLHTLAAGESTAGFVEFQIMRN